MILFILITIIILCVSILTIDALEIDIKTPIKEKLLEIKERAANRVPVYYDDADGDDD